jgi:hypothetical protein
VKITTKRRIAQMIKRILCMDHWVIFIEWKLIERRDLPNVIVNTTIPGVFASM